MYKKIDKLIKLKNKVFDFSPYGLENYANKIYLINKRFYSINNGKFTLIKNIRVIKDLLLNCCKNIHDKSIYIDLCKKYNIK